MRTVTGSAIKSDGRMFQVLFYAPKDIRLVEVPVPHPGLGEVLVRIGAALTCGTDFKAYRQGHKVLLGELPAPFGHELAGTIVAVGEGVMEFKPGDRVVAANSAPCDGCFYCTRGQSQLCERLKLHNGAYAEYNLVPRQIVRHNLYRIPPGLDFAKAALAEPLACAIHAVDVVAAAAGETAVILGAGSMSLLLTQALKARGARVLVVGRGDENLAVARLAGADETFSVNSGDPGDWVRGLTAGLGADCVFEAVGKPETWAAAISLVRRGGRVCLFGGCAAGTQATVDAHRVHYGQISLHGVFHHTPKYFAQAVGLIASDRVRSDILIAGRIALHEVCRFFDRWHGRSNPKVAVIP